MDQTQQNRELHWIPSEVTDVCELKFLSEDLLDVLLLRLVKAARHDPSVGVVINAL